MNMQSRVEIHSRERKKKREHSPSQKNSRLYKKQQLRSPRDVPIGQASKAPARYLLCIKAWRVANKRRLRYLS